MAPLCKASHTAPYGVLLHVHGAWIRTHFEGCRYVLIIGVIMIPRMLHMKDFFENWEMVVSVTYLGNSTLIDQIFFRRKKKGFSIKLSP